MRLHPQYEQLGKAVPRAPNLARNERVDEMSDCNQSVDGNHRQRQLDSNTRRVVPITLPEELNLKMKHGARVRPAGGGVEEDLAVLGRAHQVLLHPLLHPRLTEDRESTIGPVDARGGRVVLDELD